VVGGEEVVALPAAAWVALDAVAPRRAQCASTASASTTLAAAYLSRARACAGKQGRVSSTRRASSTARSRRFAGTASLAPACAARGNSGSCRQCCTAGDARHAESMERSLVDTLD